MFPTPGCASGLCADCLGNCDFLTGACVDLCAGVQCDNGARCQPATGECGPLPLEACVACQVDADCPATNPVCHSNPLDASETYCSQPCASGCARGFTCVGAQGDDYCEPLLGTCVDRCANVGCAAGQTCNAYTGRCQAGQFCANSASCVALGATYCDMVNLRCVTLPGRGAASDNEQCGVDADCGAGLMCESDLGLVCRAPCDSNAECGVGDSCFYNDSGARWYCATFGP